MASLYSSSSTVSMIGISLLANVSISIKQKLFLYSESRMAVVVHGQVILKLVELGEGAVNL